MKQKIESIIHIEKMINEGLRVALRERNAVRALELFLEHIGRHYKCDRIYVFEGKQGENISNTFEWCAEGVLAEKDNLQNVPYEELAWWYDAFGNMQSIVISNLESIRDKWPLSYERLKTQNIHSLVASPLFLEDEIIGFYGVDNPKDGDLEHISNIAEIVAHFIVSLLQKEKLMKELEKLSLEDSLSNVRNRHALNDYLNRTKAAENVGVIYCDVLGLKKVNDALGHEAGDALIVRASQSLQHSFRKTDIYRIGGDEFLVLCVGLDEAIFRERVEMLRSVMREHDAIMSLGCVWCAEVSDMEALIREADKLMYEEKRTYYATHIEQ